LNSAWVETNPLNK
jgi:hypothetical protein